MNISNIAIMLKRNYGWLLLALALASCTSEWNEKNRSEFVSGCINGAVKDMPAEKARKYCHCMLEKVMARYPNAADVIYIKNDTAMAAMAKDCLKQP